MGVKNKRLKMLVRPITRWAARQALVGRNRSRHDLKLGRFTPQEVDALIVATWRGFDKMDLDISHEPTFGSRINVQLAAVTLAFFQSLLDAGITREEAIELVGDICWVLYQLWGRYGQLLRRLFHTDPIANHKKNVRPDGSWPMSFPFNPPGYRARYHPIEQGIGFDVVRCPVAEFFRQKNAGDLGAYTWCMLDYPLAEMIDLQLNRTQTLAAGNSICDFRWLRAQQVPRMVERHGE